MHKGVLQIYMNTQKLLDLASELECNVVYNEPLSKHTTFRTGGTCTAMVDISSEESLAKLVRAAHEWNVRYIVVGNGSNLLFDDKGYEGVVFLMGQSVDEIKMMNENTIYAEAGCSLIKLCRFALEHNLTGLEFAYGIGGLTLNFGQIQFTSIATALIIGIIVNIILGKNGKNKADEVK